MRIRRSVTALGLAAALVAGGASAAARADEAPSTTHGPNPTAQSITQNGPYTYATTKVARSSGFGGGTIYYPSNAAAGERFAGVVTMPGFMEPGSVMNLWGQRLASHGFVVLVAEPVTIMDEPIFRSTQVLKGVDALKADQTVAGILDGSRMGVIGHSMGGGGVLEAAQRADLQAVVALHPWDQLIPMMRAVTEPTLIVGGTWDNIAPMAQYTLPIYQSLGSADRSLITRQMGTHFAGLTNDAAIMGRTLSFLKRNLDHDDRYTPLFCSGGTWTASFQSTGCR